MREYFPLIAILAGLVAGEFFAYRTARSWTLFVLAMVLLFFGFWILMVNFTMPMNRGVGTSAQWMRFYKRTAIAGCAAVTALMGIAGAMILQLKEKARKRRAMSNEPPAPG